MKIMKHTNQNTIFKHRFTMEEDCNMTIAKYKAKTAEKEKNEFVNKTLIKVFEGFGESYKKI